MASLVAKKKGNQLYYYVVESARVNGKPRITHQTYLGTAEKVAALVKDRTAPLPLSATALDYGLPCALRLAAEQSGLCWSQGPRRAATAVSPHGTNGSTHDATAYQRDHRRSHHHTTIALDNALYTDQ